MAEAIRVAVAGYRGKVGSVLAAAFQAEPGLEYVGGVEVGDDLASFLHEKRPRALVDFTAPSAALHTALAAIASGASPVIGTTARRCSRQVGDRVQRQGTRRDHRAELCRRRRDDDASR
jgi:dihydrodipicolinate reductase